jgi:site-specific DNA-methyltransferase (adenine-specific)
VIKLHCGDCLKVLKRLPDKSVDCVVTSPPYNQLGSRIPRIPSGMHRNDRWFSKVARRCYADDLPEPDYQHWLSSIVDECLRVSKGLVWINHKLRFRGGVGIHPARFLDFPIWSEIVWARTGAIAFNCRKFAPSHELILGFGRPHFWNQASARLLSVWRITQVQNRTDHPCPFPIEIPRRLIQASCPPDGIVLDPFMGAGTTGEACSELGRNFIGIEIEPEYFGVAKSRIKAAKSAARCTAKSVTALSA